MGICICIIIIIFKLKILDWLNFVEVKRYYTIILGFIRFVQRQIWLKIDLTHTCVQE